MELFFQQTINGIMLGSTYVLVALGVTMIYGIMRLPSFAHGHFYMLGAYITFFLITLYNFSYWPALILSMVVLFFIGGLVERIVFRPLREQSQISNFIAAIGILLFIEHMVTVIWGPHSHRIPNPYPEHIYLFGASVSQQRLIVILAAVVLIALLQLFIKKTVIGFTMEATAQDREGAALVGINVNRVSSLTFSIACALAAAAASLVAPIFVIVPGMGSLLVMKAMVIFILGGLGSIPGAIIGGYISGLIEALGGGYISSEYKDVFAFGALILILAIKPTGIFGKGAA
jgi:branched-chain amino acid transport system permease protein